jgi:hypothetical protein
MCSQDFSWGMSFQTLHGKHAIFFFINNVGIQINLFMYILINPTSFKINNYINLVGFELMLKTFPFLFFFLFVNLII